MRTPLEELSSFHSTTVQAQLQAHADAIYRDRAAAVRQARAAGHTWRTIAAELGMTEIGIQRAPYVKG